MEIIIVRHGDPDYVHDTLTEKGEKEAELLAQKLSQLEVTNFYCSPLGRAKKTAQYTLDKMNRDAEILDWLHEFKGRIHVNGEEVASWDMMPSSWAHEEKYYTNKWYETDLMKNSNVKEEYDKVCLGLDKLMAKHGYIREGHLFRCDGNHDRIVLFCHYAVGAVITSYLLGISPIILLQNAVALTTSVTSFISEEREKGIASFRMNCYGDTGHLYAGNEKCSFAARFCECYEDDTKH